MTIPGPVRQSGPAKHHSGGMRRAILALLVTGGVINFLDRSALSIANLSMRAELHLSGTEIGGLLSAFSLVYGVAQLPAGWLLDSLGARLVLSAGMLVWSVAQTATGVAGRFTSLLLTRAGLGLGEAPFLPGGVKVIRDWYEPAERGLPMGLLNASTTLGQALAPPLLTLLLVSYGWRAMFVVIGVLGLMPALAWYALYREPPGHDAVRTERGKAGAVTVRDSRRLLRQPTIWGMMLGFSGVNYTAWLYLAWLPGYFETVHHVSLAATGWLAAIPFLMGSAGMLVNGVMVDVLVRRGADPFRSRKLLIVSGMVCSAGCTLGVLQASNSAAAVGATGMALFFIHFAGTSAWGLVQTTAPASLVGTVGAMQNFCSFLVASVAPLLTGWLLDRTHSFAIALLICACITLLGAGAYVGLVREPLAAGTGGEGG